MAVCLEPRHLCALQLDICLGSLAVACMYEYAGLAVQMLLNTPVVLH